MNLYFFTFTGNSRKIAEMVADELAVELREIKSLRLPYIAWLLLSFVPCMAVKIDVQPPTGKEIILCFPKWTFNCPPVTAFLKKFAKGREIRMIICYGGFDERRYAEFYKSFALKCGAKKADYLLVKRRELRENTEKVRDNIKKWLKIS
ncbi:MAG: hypothetical protein XD40_0036 [Archaeoglobus fulgidus]|uniref:Flavodoxin-like domain-containing protein n=1 Tax=Archaeoglobus fulgidus TaxID=2234 RepID=A0A101DFN7_ARCFL|nr:flavodoxin family protein [Archaeoglobus fulgidus]KUJ94715.1 MAG: hypothetical protein XD40_0036 [Archaeoglobus fulgidus]KUK06968.1 MAG: Uncharacterized protein XD48_0830 [Archaeoglobus fulgidus]